MTPSDEPAAAPLKQPALLLLLAVVTLAFGWILLPFFSPTVWRQVFERAIKMSDGQIRFIGLSSMLAGLLMLLFWR